MTESMTPFQAHRALRAVYGEAADGFTTQQLLAIGQVKGLARDVVDAAVVLLQEVPANENHEDLVCVSGEEFVFCGEEAVSVPTL